MPFIDKFDRFNKKISFFIEIFGFIALFLMMAITCIDVFGAKVFKLPVPGALDIVMTSQAMATAFAAGISQRLYHTTYAWVGHLRGGLTIATVLACSGFAAICGSTAATAVTMGKIALPEMKKYGYDDMLATGTVAAAGTLGILIPPSTILIVYGIMTEESIGKLFVAGLFPGILLSLFFVGVVAFWCLRQPQLGPAGTPMPWKERIKSLKGIVEAVILFALTIGGLFLGWFSPTQAGAIGAGGALGAGFLSKQINHKGSLAVSTLCMGIVLWSFMFLSSLTAVRIGAFLLSTAAGVTLPASVATVTAMVRREDWGKALGIHQLAPPLSLVLGPILAVIFLKWFQWTTLLAALGSIAIITSLVFAKFSRSGEFPGHSPSLPLIRSLIKVKTFWIMTAFFALCMGGQVRIYAMLPLYLISEKSLDPDLANTLLGISQVSCIGLTFVAGWLTDRLGEKKMIFLSMMAAGVTTVLLGWSSGGWLKLFVFLQPALIICYFPAAENRLLYYFFKKLWN